MATETHGDGLADATGVAEHAADSAGMPQLDFSHWGNQIFWLLVTLVAIYFLLSRIALPRIASVLSERRGTITNDIAAAEDLKKKAEEAEAAYDQALIDARAEAQKIIAEAKADIQADLDVVTVKADAEIAAKTAESEARIAEIRDGALKAAQDVANETAQAVVAAMGQNVDTGAITKAVADRLKG